jgi:putative transposase
LLSLYLFYFLGLSYRNTAKALQRFVKRSHVSIWKWVAIEPTHSQILHIDISFERTRLVAERFIAYLIDKYDKHPISKDGGTWYYPPQACQFLKLNRHIHSFYKKSYRKDNPIQYIKDRTKECFDDYFPCKRKKCKLNM